MIITQKQVPPPWVRWEHSDGKGYYIVLNTTAAAALDYATLLMIDRLGCVLCIRKAVPSDRYPLYANVNKGLLRIGIDRRMRRAIDVEEHPNRARISATTKDTDHGLMVCFVMPSEEEEE